MSAPRTLPAQGGFFSRALPYLLCIGLLLAAAGLSVAVGTVGIPLDRLGALLLRGPFASTPDLTLQTILWEIRIPRAAFIALVGMALGASGCAYQGIFRNPLADPYLLGIGSGASLGAVLAITSPIPGTGLLPIPLYAFAGALITVFLVYRGAHPGRGPAPAARLILAGVSAGAFANALGMFLLLRQSGQLQRAMSWLMGGFVLGGWSPVWISLPYVLLGVGLLTAMGRVLNLLQFGDEQAEQAGLPVGRARGILIAAASLTTAAGVAFAGVIGFVGLAVPHVVRLLWGSDYRRLVPLSALFGGATLLAADLLARTVLAPQELPVGIVTAFFGAPFFFYLLYKNRSTA